MESVALLDRAGRRRSPPTLSSFHQGRLPRNKGLRYPPDPPTVEELVAVMRAAGDSQEAVRLRGVIIMLWRAGLRISEALALTESDLDRARGSVKVRHGRAASVARSAGTAGHGSTSTHGSSSAPSSVEMSREGVPLLVIQRQLGHADLGITTAYLRGIDNTEIIHTVHERPAPMIPATSRITPRR